jgi:hypothetical protein
MASAWLAVCPNCKAWLNAFLTKSGACLGRGRSHDCVARGAGIVLDNLDEYEQLLVGIERDPYTSLTKG